MCVCVCYSYEVVTSIIEIGGSERVCVCLHVCVTCCYVQLNMKTLLFVCIINHLHTVKHITC